MCFCTSSLMPIPVSITLNSNTIGLFSSDGDVAFKEDRDSGGEEEIGVFSRRDSGKEKALKSFLVLKLLSSVEEEGEVIDARGEEEGEDKRRETRVESDAELVRGRGEMDGCDGENELERIAS